MKTIATTAAVAGCLAALPLHAEQAPDQSWQLALGATGNSDSDDLTGLFGTYPASRDASGTAWQPDSTSSDGSRDIGSQSPGTQFLSGPGNDRFSLSGSNTVSVTHGLLGHGTLDLQSSVSTYSRADSEVYSEPDQRPPLSYARLGSGERVRILGVAASYSLPVSSRSSVFGYFGVPGEPTLGPPVSYMRRLSGVDNPEAGRASHWLDSSANGPGVFTVGYAWRALKLEGSAFSWRNQDDRQYAGKDVFRFDSTSTRLSYNPAPNWSFQFSRGTLSSLDQLAPDEEVRRVTLSATYNRVLNNGNWQSTFAWGRNARKSHEPSMGYLLESTLRFSGRHAVFGRMEQVGSGELVAEGGAAMSRTFKFNRFTFGYFHESGARGPVRLDAGVFVTRYAVPASAAAVYEGDPASFMFFVRLNVR